MSWSSACSCGLPELLAIERFEWILFRADGVFVFEERQYALPPFVVCCAKFLDDLRMIGNDIIFFARVVLQIVELGIIHQGVLPVANRAARVLGICGLAMRPTANMRHEVSIGPISLWIFKERPKAAAFDL